MKLSTMLAFCAVLVLPSPGFAQFEACPGGVQAGQQCGGGVCQPICQYAPPTTQSPTPNSATRLPPPLPTHEWREVTFNAAALSADIGAYGVSSGHASQISADSDALRRCAAAGGKACEIIGGGQNSCLALARSPESVAMFWILSGPASGSNEDLERRLLEGCKKSSKDQACELLQTVCEEDRDSSEGPSTSPQPGVRYNGNLTPSSPMPQGPSFHHCGPGRLPVLVRMSNRPGANAQQMHCLLSTNAPNDPHPTAIDGGFVDRRFEWFEDRFAASAIDDEGDAYGLATNARTQAEAEAEAMARCRAAGGKSCVALMQLDNVCMGLARGPGLFRYGLWGYSEESTAREVVAECTKQAAGATCTLLAVACSYGAYTGLQLGPQPSVSYRYTPPPQ